MRWKLKIEVEAQKREGLQPFLDCLARVYWAQIAGRIDTKEVKLEYDLKEEKKGENESNI